jgi:acetate kinase
VIYHKKVLRICEGLGFLGIELEKDLNTCNTPVISKDTGQAVVRVIHINEEYMIARTVCRVLEIDFLNTISTGKNNEQK